MELDDAQHLATSPDFQGVHESIGKNLKKFSIYELRENVKRLEVLLFTSYGLQKEKLLEAV